MSSLSRELAQLGTLFEVRETLVTRNPVGGAQLLVPSDPRRWKIIICVPSSVVHDYYVATNPTTINQGGGYPVTRVVAAGIYTPHPFEADFRSDGAIVQQAWYGAALNGSGVADSFVWTIFEVLLPN